MSNHHYDPATHGEAYYDEPSCDRCGSLDFGVCEGCALEIVVLQKSAEQVGKEEL
jgi:hypothetical protein